MKPLMDSGATQTKAFEQVDSKSREQFKSTITSFLSSLPKDQSSILIIDRNNIPSVLDDTIALVKQTHNIEVRVIIPECEQKF